MKKTIDDFTCIGKIINTHGLKGELKIEPYTSNIERFSDLSEVYVGNNLVKYKIKKVRYAKFVYITFDENEDINKVLPLKTQNIYIPDDERINLDKDEFFISDLIGKKVFHLNGKYIGILNDIFEYPANDVFVVETEDKKIIQIPAVKEFVKSIDDDIIVDLIEGMIL